jgi:hypothetical protein
MSTSYPGSYLRYPLRAWVRGWVYVGYVQGAYVIITLPRVTSRANLVPTPTVEGERAWERGWPRASRLHYGILVQIHNVY